MVPLPDTAPSHRGQNALKCERCLKICKQLSTNIFELLRNDHKLDLRLSQQHHLIQHQGFHREHNDLVKDLFCIGKGTLYAQHEYICYPDGNRYRPMKTLVHHQVDHIHPPVEDPTRITIPNAAPSSPPPKRAANSGPVVRQVIPGIRCITARKSG